jgi:putative acetyltransferase
MNVTIRRENPGDEQGIREVNLNAFETTAEADVIDRLREACPEFMSFVALDEARIVGQLLFTPAVTIEQGIKGMGLAPLAVHSDYQNQGIGTALMRYGIAKIREAGYPFIIVLGHPDYYPRFGFVPASRYGLVCEYPGVPDEAFMILVFDQDALKNVSGIVKYRPEFADSV